MLGMSAPDIAPHLQFKQSRGGSSQNAPQIYYIIYTPILQNKSLTFITQSSIDTYSPVIVDIMV